MFSQTAVRLLQARDAFLACTLMMPCRAHRLDWEEITRVVGGERPSAPVRVAVVAAHPDDEVMGAAALLRRLASGPACIYLLHLTDGAPADGRDARERGFPSVTAYARARRDELDAALTAAEIDGAECVQFGVKDQQAAFSLRGLTRSLGGWLRSYPVDLVLSHPFEGGHPDHDAAAFAVHTASARLGEAAPTLVEFASYHAGPGGMTAGTFLEGTGSEGITLALTKAEQERKRKARDCFVSQAETLARFDLSRERFRLAPRYDFRRRPHPGPLLYEQLGWGLDGDRWERLAAAALAQVG